MFAVDHQFWRFNISTGHTDASKTKLDSLGISSQGDGLMMALILASGFIYTNRHAKLDDKKIVCQRNNLLELRKGPKKIFNILYHIKLIWTTLLIYALIFGITLCN